ncbi:MAG: hypothetical protein Fur0021_40350 [Candidatus Promineifilaceae bacterium]
MPIRVIVGEGIISDIAVAVQAGRVCWVHDEDIWTDEPSYSGQIEPSPHIDKPQIISRQVVVGMTGKSTVCKGLGGGGAIGAEGEVASAAATDHTPGAGVTHNTVATQVVVMQV